MLASGMPDKPHHFQPETDMSSQILTQYRRPQSLAERFWAPVAAFLDRVADINARNGATGPFGL